MYQFTCALARLGGYEDQPDVPGGVIGCVLMRAAHAAGNPAGVEALWQELLAVLDTDLDLVDEDLHPDTVALYTSLRGSRRPRPAQPGGHPTIPQN